jgi:KDO2-lipid IV(A) lauroyltransferase
MLLFILYKLAWLGVRIVPRPMCVWVAKRIADTCFFFDTKARRAVIANLEHILSTTGRETESRRGRQGITRLARETFENFAVHIMDFMRLDRVRDDIETGLLRIEGFETFREALSRGRGVISVTAHIGNWEMGAAAAAQAGFPLSAVTLRMPDRRLEGFFVHLRERGGIRPMPSGHAARECFHVLQKNGLLAFVGDRLVDGVGHRVRFFGEEVEMPRGPAEIAARTGAPIIPGFCIQEATGHFRLIIERPIEVDEGLSQDQKVEETMRKLGGTFELYISRYPAQWFAFYKVWGQT